MVITRLVEAADGADAVLVLLLELFEQGEHLLLPLDEARQCVCMRIPMRPVRHKQRRTMRVASDRRASF